MPLIRRLFSRESVPSEASLRVLLLAVALGGLLLTLLLASIVWWGQARQLQERFEHLAQERRTLIEEQLLLQRRNLENLASFMQLKPQVSRQQFATFVQPFVQDALAYSWIPRVSGSQREALEREVAASDWAGFRILDLQGDGRLQPAAPRELYYPLLYSQSARLPSLPIGLDLLSQPTRRAALLESVNQAQAVASGLLRPVGVSQQDTAAVILFMPVFREARQPPVALRAGEALGVVSAVISLSQVLESHSERGAKQLSLELTAAQSGELLYRSRQAADGLLQWQTGLRLGLSDYHLLIRPTAAFTAANRSLAFLWVALAGSLFSILLVMLLSLLLGQRQRALRLVAERTQELRWSEAELRQASARLGHALDGSGYGIWDWTLASDELFCSAAWANMLGLAGSEVPHTYQDWLARVHPLDRDGMLRELNGHLQGSSTFYRHEHRLLTGAGEWLWVLDRGRVVEQDEQGGALRIIGTMTDISVRKNSELQLARTLGELHAILDSATQVAIIATDLDGCIRTFNIGAERMLGYAAAEVVGQHTPLLFHDVEEVAAREQLLSAAQGRLVRGFQALVAGSLGLQDSDAREWSYRCKDGRRLTVNLLVSAMRDPDGVPQGYLGVAIDVSAERQAREALLAQQALLNKLSAQVPGVIYQYLLRPDGSSCFPWCSEGVRQIYEVAPADVHEDASDAFSRILLEEQDRVRLSILRSAQQLSPWCEEFRVQLPSRGLRWLRGEATPERQADGSVLWHGYITDITAGKDIEEELRQLSVTDALTGVFNRRYFQQRLAEQLQLAQRIGESLALIMLDIDYFKQVNDTYGHEVGDEVLKELCRRLGQRLRRSDVLCRIGGEEFVVLCPGSQAHQAHELAESLWQVVREQPFATVGQVTASFGVTSWQNGDDADSLLRRADEGVYAAKQAGRDRVIQRTAD